jgi:hypothetical protein
MGIPPERVRAWAERQGSAENLQRAVAERFLADNSMPVGNSRIEEFPEDVVLALLQDKSLPKSLIGAAADGWRDARWKVQAVLDDPQRQPDEVKRAALAKAFTRVFRVAEISAHNLLRDDVISALRPALYGTHLTQRQVQQVVAAATRFADELDRKTWEKLLQPLPAGKPEVVTYAFRVLLQLDKDSSFKLAEHFTNVLERQLVDEWPIDCGILAGLLEKTGKSDAIRLGTIQFLGEHPDSRPAILERHSDPCWAVIVAVASVGVEQKEVRQSVPPRIQPCHTSTSIASGSVQTSRYSAAKSVYELPGSIQTTFGLFGKIKRQKYTKILTPWELHMSIEKEDVDELKFTETHEYFQFHLRTRIDPQMEVYLKGNEYRARPSTDNR